MAREKLRGNTTASRQAARTSGGVTLMSLLFAGLVASLIFSAKFITVAIIAVAIAGVVVGLWRIARRWPG
jgi:dolichyl-phosphate-mannose--protein O-mannosyl transferase